MVLLAALPILVELFTSEGCSSCPPADATLARLHEKQPLKDVQLLVLSEHVDYWNNLGWRDPFSDGQFSDRQERYGFRVYTPQAVIDGVVDVVGSDEEGILQAARGAAAAPHGAVRFEQKKEKKFFFDLFVDSLPPHGPTQVLLAEVEDGLVSRVERGENSGRTLAHTAVVRSLTGIGAIAASAKSWSGEIPAPAKGRRAVVFVQDRDSHRILAAAAVP